MKDENPPKRAPETPQDYATKRPTLRRMEVRKMLTTEPPPVPWVAEPLLVRGRLTLLTGKPGEGKSMLSQALAVAVATGSSVAGLEAEKGGVLVIDGENGEEELHRRVHSLGLPVEANERFELYEAEQFNLGQELEEIDALLKRHRPSVLVLDSFRSLWIGDENESGGTSAALDAICSLLRRYEASGLLLHHLGKGGANGAFYRGSTAILGSCQLAFKLDRAEGDSDNERRRLSCFKMRPAAEPELIWLRLEASDGRILVSEAEPFEGAKPVSDELETKVLRAVTDGLRSRSEIATEVGKPPKDGSVGRVLKGLVKGGSLERTGNEYHLPKEGAVVPLPLPAGTLAPSNDAASLAAIRGEVEA
jgi:SpoVK/Ycf46/Vps4 family AAA+-type ATPase